MFHINYNFLVIFHWFLVWTEVPAVEPFAYFITALDLENLNKTNRIVLDGENSHLSKMVFMRNKKSTNFFKILPLIFVLNGWCLEAFPVAFETNAGFDNLKKEAIKDRCYKHSLSHLMEYLNMDIMENK